MLHRDISGLVIADFRINVADNLTVHLVRQGIITVHPLNQLARNPHGAALRFIQGLIILAGGLHSQLLLFRRKHNFPAGSQKRHGLDLGNLRQNLVLQPLFQSCPLRLCLPYSPAVYRLIGILLSGQIYHKLRKGTGGVLQTEYFIFIKTGGKYDFYRFRAAAGIQRQQAGCQKAARQPHCCFFHSHFPMLLIMLLATLRPLAEAC